MDAITCLPQEMFEFPRQRGTPFERNFNCSSFGLNDFPTAKVDGKVR